MSATESKQDSKKAAEHAAAKADVKIELQQKARELKAEAAQIDGQIQELEIKAAQESDEARVLELLAERTRLVERKQALPFLLRGTQARALKRQAAALYEEAEALKADLDVAEKELEVATKRIPELELELAQANEVLAKTTARRDQLQHQHYTLHTSASHTVADAKCIERGEAPQFRPGAYDI